MWGCAFFVLANSSPLCEGFTQSNSETVNERSELVLLGAMVSSLDFQGFLQALWTFLGLQQQILQLLQKRKENVYELK